MSTETIETINTELRWRQVSKTALPPNYLAGYLLETPDPEYKASDADEQDGQRPVAAVVFDLRRGEWRGFLVTNLLGDRTYANMINAKRYTLKRYKGSTCRPGA